MGNCSPVIADPPGPTLTSIITPIQLETRIYAAHRPLTLHFTETMYGSYTLNELKRFLQSSIVFRLKSLHGAFSAENLSLILLGEERKWLGQLRPWVGSTFGYMIGKIYENEYDIHPVRSSNCFIDPNGLLWAIHPVDFHIFRPSTDSQVEVMIF